MRLAAISDIHGNCLALEAVLADLARRPPDALICLGDAIQGGPQPAETVARLRDLACPVVMGNADAWLLSGVETGDVPVSPERRLRLDAVRGWSLAQLSADDRAFIAGFNPHGRPGARRRAPTPWLPRFARLVRHADPALTPDEELQRVLGPYADRLLCGGHTHVQQIRHMGRSFYFNPGAVGFAYRHGQSKGQFRADAWAEYAVLTVEGEGLALEFRRVPYDAEQLIQIYRASGRPFADQAVAQYAAR